MSGGREAAPPSGRPARFHAGLAAAFAAFVVYGSLVPFHYQPLPPGEADARFREVCSRPVRVESRSDWAANILLFVPLGYLCMGARYAGGRGGGLLGAAATVAGCAAFSALIEFTQLYFPPRVSSLNDIVAETVGAVLGIALWIAAGRRLTRGARAAWAGTGGGGAAARLLIAYLVVLALVQVFPPNLTLSPVELYHKYKAGLVRPVPFAYWAVDPRDGVRKALEGAAWFLPLGLLAARVPRWRAGGRAAREVFILGLGTAAGAEFLRLFVVTHSCDASDVATNGFAVLYGWCVGLSSRRPAVRVLAAAGWIVALAYLNWYPFDFHFDATASATRREISWLPFADYLQSSYLEAAQGAADKAIQFFVLGALLAPSRRPAGAPAWAAIGAAGILAVLFEAGQLCLPTRFPSVTDVLVETSSAGLGLWAWARLRQARTSNLTPAS
jgi:VanZ family protein